MIFNAPFLFLDIDIERYLQCIGFFFDLQCKGSILYVRLHERYFDANCAFILTTSLWVGEQQAAHWQPHYLKISQYCYWNGVGWAIPYQSPVENEDSFIMSLIRHPMMIPYRASSPRMVSIMRNSSRWKQYDKSWLLLQSRIIIYTRFRVGGVPCSSILSVGGGIYGISSCSQTMEKDL
jgi:hypothetical protein